MKEIHIEELQNANGGLVPLVAAVGVGISGGIGAAGKVAGGLSVAIIFGSRVWKYLNTQ